MKDMTLCVSVIIPVYKVEKYLKRCLDSVIDQTYSNLEIIVVDNDSPDKCGSIADSYAAKDPRIRVIHRKDDGIAMARNAGLELAGGDWISFVDSDDVLARNAVEILLESAVKSDVPMVMGGYYVCIHKKQRIMCRRVHLTPDVINSAYDMHRYFNSEGMKHNYLWMRLYKKEIFDNVRFRKGKCYEDIFAAKDIIESAGSMAVIDEPIYYYHLRNDSITFGDEVRLHMDGLFARIEWMNYIRSRYPDILPYSRDALLEYCCYMLGKIYLLGKREHRKEWDYVVRCFGKACYSAAKDNIFIRLAVYVFNISPDVLGILCMIYSKIKNG